MQVQPAPGMASSTIQTFAHSTNETLASRSRRTDDGRLLTYHLEVIQQPLRARACGQGAKSSTDRRPVDPPPIIKLVVTSGDHELRDVTFEHRSNFFLYATLEEARPVARPRGTTPHAVELTGTPVASVSYLEKPSLGGYSVFSDLSVRHEGCYRLVFSLYEDIKYSQDFSPTDVVDPVSGSSMYCRVEIKTQPFTVYSAKKFPGLLESTQMSRLVSDQGCRVRIRRDIRMRRRDTKDVKQGWTKAPDHGRPDEITETHRAQQQNELLAGLNEHHSRTFTDTAPGSAKPEAPELPSYSNGYNPSQYLLQPPPQHPQPQQQPPHQPAQQPQQQQQQIQPPQPHIGPPSSHSQPASVAHIPRNPQTICAQQYDHDTDSAYFENSQQGPSSRSTSQHPNLPAQYSPQPLTTVYTTSHAAYAQAPQYPTQSPLSQLYGPSSRSSFYPEAPPSEQQTPESWNHSRRTSYMSPVQDPYERKSQVLPPLYEPHVFSGHDVSQSTGPYRTSTPSSSTSLPPFKTFGYPARETSIAPPSTDVLQQSHEPENHKARLSNYPPRYVHGLELPLAGKRAFGNVFSSRHTQVPLHHGARPELEPEGGISPIADDDDYDDMDLPYRRAEGTRRSVNWNKYTTGDR